MRRGNGPMPWTLFKILAALPWILLCFPQDSDCADMSSVAGRWAIRINGGGEIYKVLLSIENRDGEWMGRYESDGRRSRVKDLVLKENTLTVVVATQRFSTPVTATFSCDLDGENMSGEVDFDSGSRARSYDFKGTRISAPVTAEAGSSGPGDSAEPDAKAETTESNAAAPKQPRPIRKTVSFRDGVDDYDSTVDAEIWAIAPSKSLLRQGTMTTDGNNGGGESQVLLRFDDVFGDGPGRVPANARIVSAGLTVVAFDPGTTCYVHRMLVPWTPAVTWDGMANGVSIDNLEASTVRDGFTFGEINMDKQLVQFNVTETVRRWSEGESNHGWVFMNTGGNGWDFYSSDWIEREFRPQLVVTYELPQ